MRLKDRLKRKSRENLALKKRNSLYPWCVAVGHIGNELQAQLSGVQDLLKVCILNKILFFDIVHKWEKVSDVRKSVKIGICFESRSMWKISETFIKFFLKWLPIYAVLLEQYLGYWKTRWGQPKNGKRNFCMFHHVLLSLIPVKRLPICHKDLPVWLSL